MNHQELYNLLKTVKKNIRCPQCGKQYAFSQIKIRGVSDTIVFLELSCSDHMPVLATVALTGDKKDIIPEDRRPSVSNNDVIDTYNFLQNFSGGFDKIFNNK